MFRKKFGWVICMATAWEFVGFVCRTISTFNQLTDTVTSEAVLFVLLAPLWLNAFDYIVFGRMIYYYLPEKRIAGIKAEKIATVFVLMDILAFIVQLIGGVMGQNGDGSMVTLGLNIYSGGVALQQAFILSFISLIIIFHRKMLRGETVQGRHGWKKLLYPLYATLLLITLRIIYRIVEFANGGNAELNDNEVFIYVLDASPMLFGMIIWNIWHPGRTLLGPDSEPPKVLSRRILKSNARRAIRREEHDARKERRAAGKESPSFILMEHSGINNEDDDNVNVSHGMVEHWSQWPLIPIKIVRAKAREIGGNVGSRITRS
ncbi:hypothetical protein MMC18_002502 [Xylographa bjoerkii]|nr:hypothetical protein [Xylographa bjoerkii]